jgi:F-type H+-transporting ATPase subunit gamma
MTESTANLQRKIGSAADLQSVVQAMKAKAAASIGQYANSVAALSGYARTVELGLGACFRQAPLLAAGPMSAQAAGDRSIRAVVFGSDQGLVGRFNDTLVEYARETLGGQSCDANVWAVGERMSASLVDQGIAPQDSFAVPDTVQAISRLVTDILVTVVDTTPISREPGEGLTLHLFYNRPTSAAAYLPVAQTLLPLDTQWCMELIARPWPTNLPPELLDSVTATLRGLIREHVFISLFRASAESLASENASRLAAMERADKNIDNMLQSLQGRYHRLRQSSIDEELSDVISGFKALTHSSSP